MLPASMLHDHLLGQVFKDIGPRIIFGGALGLLYFNEHNALD